MVSVLFGQAHVDRYLETDGAEGHEWHRGTHILILTTTGRRTGRQRDNALIYGRHGEDYLVVASKGGAHQHPGWYHNLTAHPEVTVQVKGDRFRARARTASAAEKPELWKAMASLWPDYDAYQTRTTREIPVVVLQRLNGT